MGLYRNIGGFLDRGRAVGLSLYTSPSLTLLGEPTTTVLPSPFSDPAAYQQQQQAAQDAYLTEMQARYDWLMSHTLAEVKAAGYYVDPTDGSVFQWQDTGHTTSVTYLALSEIQRIENAAGTAGALLQHLQEPILAIDTAGFSSGSSVSFYQEAGIVPYSQLSDSTTPTEAAADIKPVVTPTPLPTDLTTTVKNNVLPLATLAAITFVAVEGDNVLGKQRKIAFVGGVALLFYLMSKK